MLEPANIFGALPETLDEEFFGTLLQTAGFRLERIVSKGHSTPAGQWYDQDHDEWILVLSGSARLGIDGEDALVELTVGDWLLLPAHKRHRVEWTAPDVETVWLALHYGEARTRCAQTGAQLEHP